MILTGDLGGTNCRLAVFEEKNLINPVIVEKYQSKNFTSLEHILEQFITTKNLTDIKLACFGVPGPVVHGEARITNLPWIITEKSLKLLLKTDKVLLVNDLVAIAMSIPFLQSDEVTTIYTVPSLSTVEKEIEIYAVIAPGTGLGQALFIKDNEKFRAYPSEGGHSDFAPTNEKQDQLLLYLRRELKTKISWEHVISGRGLPLLHSFITGSSDSKLTGSSISKRAQLNNDQSCVLTMHFYTELLGNYAGNVALYYDARGGIYLAGGVTINNLNFLISDNFRNSYLNRGKLTSLVASIPVYGVKLDNIGIRGSAVLAGNI
jgi:glucokinase